MPGKIDNTPLEIIILAAGRGTRMHSHRPKVLHHLAGLTLLEHVLKTARKLKPNKLHVVSGYGTEQIRAAFNNEEDVSWVLQKEQNGTAHAVQQALHFVNENARILVLYGDVPLVGLQVLQRCILSSGKNNNNVRLVTTLMDDPAGLGRIVRDDADGIREIIED